MQERKEKILTTENAFFYPSFPPNRIYGIIITEIGGNMKSKKFSKKLTLNKKTIVHLNNDVMEKVHGGVVTVHNLSICPICPATVHLSNCHICES